MRVTNRMMTNHSIQYMADNMERINDLSDRISSGKQFQNASDDPVSASLSLTLRSTLKATTAYRTTSELADNWMSASDFAFDQVQTIGNRAVNLIQRGLNDTLSGTERASALATEMDKLLQQALDVGNYSHDGQYLFSGYKTDQKPFAYDPAVDPDTVTYQGDHYMMRRTISPGQTVDINVDGDAAFSPFFSALIEARNNLNANDTATLATTLTALQNALDGIDQKRTSNGARQRQVQSAEEYLDKVEFEVKGLLTKKEDINMAEAISSLRSQETTYQSVLEVGQRSISALNLFDYLR